jgi:hypothetical protein
MHLAYRRSALGLVLVIGATATAVAASGPAGATSGSLEAGPGATAARSVSWTTEGTRSASGEVRGRVTGGTFGKGRLTGKVVGPTGRNKMRLRRGTITYEFTGNLRGTKVVGTWRMIRGTGRYRGIRGSGRGVQNITGAAKARFNGNASW